MPDDTRARAVEAQLAEANRLIDVCDRALSIALRHVTVKGFPAVRDALLELQGHFGRVTLDVALAAAREPSAAAEPPTCLHGRTGHGMDLQSATETPCGSVCLDCGIPSGVDGPEPMALIVPRNHWLLIHPEERGYLCARCMIVRASKLPGAIDITGIITFGSDYDDGKEHPYDWATRRVDPSATPLYGSAAPKSATETGCSCGAGCQEPELHASYCPHWKHPLTPPAAPKDEARRMCRDCGVNEADECFTVCSPCWDKAHPKREGPKQRARALVERFANEFSSFESPESRKAAFASLIADELHNDADRLAALERENAELRGELAEAKAWSDDEEAQPEAEDIAAAHPSRSRQHDTYREAMRLVGVRRSKYALVDLVNWLLVGRSAAESQLRAYSVAQVRLGERIEELEAQGTRMREALLPLAAMRCRGYSFGCTKEMPCDTCLARQLTVGAALAPSAPEPTAATTTGEQRWGVWCVEAAEGWYMVGPGERWSGTEEEARKMAEKLSQPAHRCNWRYEARPLPPGGEKNGE